MEVILPQLTEAETEVYKRGRNRHRVATPKSANAQEYRRATGLECVFGALYLSGEQMRFDTLFALCCTKENLLLAADRAKPAT